MNSTPQAPSTLAATSLSNRRGQLIISLPANDVEMAKIAIDSGADVVKCHINITHASGREFGTLGENRDVFEKILELGVPLGLVPGAQQAMITEPEVDEAREMGIAFLNADISAARPYLTKPGLEFVPSVGGDQAERLSSWLPMLNAYPGTWIEASAVGIEGHAKPVRLQDLLGLRHMGQSVDRRIIVPTVRAMETRDVPYLFDIPEVWALMAGVFVVGNTPESLAAATKSFRLAIDSAVR